jgi:hypothetical protein
MYFLIGTPSRELSQFLADHGDSSPTPLLSGGAFFSPPLKSIPIDLADIHALTVTVVGQANVLNSNSEITEALVALHSDGLIFEPAFTPYFRLAIDPMRSKSTRYFLKSVYDSLHNLQFGYSVNWVDDSNGDLLRLFSPHANSQLAYG